MDCAAWFGSSNGLFAMLGIMFLFGILAGFGIAPHLPQRLKNLLGL